MPVISLVGWKLVLIFWVFSWKGDYDLPLSLDAHASYPPIPRPHPRYLVPEGIHLVFEELLASI